MKVIKLDEYACQLEQRKAELGIVGNDYVMPNSGVNRTSEKRRLLQFIYEQCLRNNRKPPFLANF